MNKTTDTSRDSQLLGAVDCLTQAATRVDLASTTVMGSGAGSLQDYLQEHAEEADFIKEHGGSEELIQAATDKEEGNASAEIKG